MKRRIGWKLYFAFYVALIASETFMDVSDGSGILLMGIKSIFALAFSLPLYCYSFSKNLIPKKMASVIFYVCIFWLVLGLGSTGTSIEQILTTLAILVLYAPGFVAINRYRRSADA